ncbi:MFS transporter [Mycoplasmatota bacterium]|nr:MFS transporter [Mycoplasmatota bacterium]
MEKGKNKSFRKFLIIWLGQFISSVGSGLTAFALGVFVYKTTHSVTYVSLVTLCAFLPTILLSPIGGVLADRFDRRLMMIIGDGSSTFGLIYIFVIMMIGDIQVWQICIGVLFSAIFFSLTEPAYKATITDLLTKEEFSKASGLVQLAGSSKYLLSPIIAGFLLVITTVKTILVIDICTFFVTIFAVAMVRKTLKSQQIIKECPNFIKDLNEGWKNISTKGIIHLTVLLTIVTFYIGFLQTLFTPLILPLADTKTLGMIESISAVGMLLGSLFISAFTIKKSYTHVLVMGLGLAGIFYSLIGLTTNIYLITGAGFLFFSTLPFINMSADVLIRKNIANEAQGRAWGIIGVISQLGYVFAYGLAGILVDHIFNPLLSENGLLASNIGKVIGTGQGRGIGLLFIISGLFIVILSLIILNIKSIKTLEK